MNRLLILFITFNLFSCSNHENVEENNWLCDNKAWLIQANSKIDTVLIDLSKSSHNQLNSLNQQLSWNTCNQTYLLNGIINFSDSTKILVAYRARPYCPNDTTVRPISCFPDPTISVYFLSDTIIKVENRIINLNHLPKNEPYFTFEYWNMFKNKIFEFNDYPGIDITVKEKVLKGLYNRHFSILDSLCLKTQNKTICQLNSIQIDSIRKVNPVFFAQTELPPIPIEIESLEDDLDIDLSVE